MQAEAKCKFEGKLIKHKKDYVFGSLPYTRAAERRGDVQRALRSQRDGWVKQRSKDFAKRNGIKILLLKQTWF